MCEIMFLFFFYDSSCLKESRRISLARLQNAHTHTLSASNCPLRKAAVMVVLLLLHNLWLRRSVCQNFFPSLTFGWMFPSQFDYPPPARKLRGNFSVLSLVLFCSLRLPPPLPHLPTVCFSPSFSVVRISKCVCSRFGHTYTHRFQAHSHLEHFICCPSVHVCTSLFCNCWWGGRWF